MTSTNPIGRPTEYKSEYCDKVIEWGKLGKSIAWMSASLDVSRQSVYRWAEEHADFSDALTRAKEHSQQWWEDKGQECMLMMPGMGNFNGSVWSRSMAARFPEDWREKSETALTGSGGGPLIVQASAHDEKL